MTQEGPAILLAEHEAGIVELYKALALAHPEWRFESCHDGAQALAMAQQHTPDVVIADLGLPLLDAIELCAELKAQPSTSKIPVIVVTGHAERAFRVAAFQAGVHEVLVKPFRMGDLVGAIERALAGGS